jgi:hypothetical protein
MTCTPQRQARSVSSPIAASSASCAWSVASASPPGRSPSPMEKLTSCVRMIWQIVSHMLVHRVLFVVDEHPLGEQRAAAGDDADEPVLHQRDVPLEHARVQGHVIDALLAWCSTVSRMMSRSRSSIFRPMIIE